VIYSNNLRWEDVPLAVEFGKVVPCPVRIANDADCAALGEAAAGAGKDVSDLVMFTLGNGVGGGIILKGEIFEGGIMGGSEVGHQVIRVNGRRCSCGRKGCLEAYVSMPALIRSASQAAGRELEIREIFENAEEGDIVMQEVLEQYTQMLGQGIVNIVNMFRPQMIILGGLVSEYADILRDPIMRMISEDTFGGNLGKLPELRTSVLGSDAGMIGAANL
jgi:predicted NBD/HSP70 family sugar kinase